MEAITADVLFFEPDTVYSGKEYKLTPHVATTVGYFSNIIDKELISYDLQEDEYSAVSSELVRAEIDLNAPYCIERWSEFPRLSRFVVREMNRVIACGKCVK